ncbi:hypothetical protein V3C99_011572 [Haemonchus contortus]|uniref:CCHC-type domain-containing protein n=1 Tax=Haemonchus contortus TaxID=6289 RepID=A0A7I5E9P1_HAECO
MADDEGINEQPDEVPMEPDDTPEINEQPQQQPQEAPQVQQLQQGEPRLNNDHEEIPLIHRKIQRILGRTDDISPMRQQVDNTHRELRLVERRTFTLKEMLEESLDGLTQIFKLQKQMIAMLEELRYVPSREPSPQPGSSRQQPQQQSSNKCGFCDSPDHFAADCKQYFTLRDRSRRATERFRCERCLKRASHLATSCPTEKVCHYCKVAKREKEMVKHNSAFCPHKFPLE